MSVSHCVIHHISRHFNFEGILPRLSFAVHLGDPGKEYVGLKTANFRSASPTIGKMLSAERTEKPLQGEVYSDRNKAFYMPLSKCISPFMVFIFIFSLNVGTYSYWIVHIYGNYAQIEKNMRSCKNQINELFASENLSKCSRKLNEVKHNKIENSVVRNISNKYQKISDVYIENIMKIFV